MLKVVDLEAVTDFARDRDILVVADNTFATPYLQRPLEYGCDIVMHSVTKFLNGHSDMVGGIAVTADEQLADRLAFLQNSIGSVPGPFDSFLALRGLKTLDVRMQRHCSNAEAIARWLENDRRVESVIYPGLESHPQHARGEIADVGLWRHRNVLHQRRARRGSRIPRTLRSVRAGRKPGRRREPGRPPRHHDPRFRPRRKAPGARHQRPA